MDRVKPLPFGSYDVEIHMYTGVLHVLRNVRSDHLEIFLRFIRDAGNGFIDIAPHQETTVEQHLLRAQHIQSICIVKRVKQ